MYPYLGAIAVLLGLLQALQLRAEEKPKPVAQKIESPKGTFFFEVREPSGDRGRFVWIVSAKDPAVHEPLPGFDEMKDSAINFALISPDENWIFFDQHFGSHAESTHLYRRKDGLKFEPVFKFKGFFDGEAWKFASKVEGVPRKGVYVAGEIYFHEWSPDSGRLLFRLYGNLDGTLYD